MQREVVIDKLKSVKSKYQQDGFNIIALFGSYATNSQNNSSDIDLLYEVDNSFLEKYKGFKSVSKVLQIQEELSSLFHTKVDLTSPSGLNQRIKEEIISKAIYV
ncbi:MAG: nucleotidyltransferase domain-containing protein [Aliarcobacter sp.]|jgi:predicted nucleotidyltransferase|nr:nucleotidyltransferase domain-containing protein [Aliarcobacter sp.]